MHVYGERLLVEKCITASVIAVYPMATGRRMHGTVPIAETIHIRHAETLAAVRIRQRKTLAVDSSTAMTIAR